MEIFANLVRAEFTPKNTFLNTAANALLPARTVTALGDAVRLRAEGGPLDPLYDDVEASRAAYARLAGVPVERVAVGAGVTLYTALIAASLQPGAEVLTVENDFASVLNPFHVRGDLKVRAVPLERLAESVGPDTALVAVSAVQSADGRIADLPALREAARAHGARTYVDLSQAIGWLPVDAGAFDYSVAIVYKWLLGPHGGAFLAVPEDFGDLVPVQASWAAGRNPGPAATGPSPNSPTPPAGSTRAPPSSPTRGCGPPSNSSRRSGWTPSTPTTSPWPTASGRGSSRGATSPCPRPVRPSCPCRDWAVSSRS